MVDLLCENPTINPEATMSMYASVCGGMYNFFSFVHVCVYIYINVDIYMYTYTYICIHICMHIYKYFFLPLTELTR